jgi:hypothetical protein
MLTYDCVNLKPYIQVYSKPFNSDGAATCRDRHMIMHYSKTYLKIILIILQIEILERNVNTLNGDKYSHHHLPKGQEFQKIPINQHHTAV